MEHGKSGTAGGRGRTRGATRSRGQAIVEFSLVAPLLLMVAFMTIDLGRLIYVWVAISDASSWGARTLTLASQEQSDCLTIARTEQVASGFGLTVDPNSVAGNSDPTNPSGAYRPTTPPGGQGYIYVWPAVATADPPGTFCSGSTRPTSAEGGRVAVQIEYHFVPLTPIPHADFVIRSVSVEATEY